MAQKITLVDDIDETPIEDGKGGTVRFSLDGSSYEIDLNDDNAEKLRTALSAYVKSARKVGARPTSVSASSSAKSDPKLLKAIRQWANENGHPVSDRGRIPGEIQAAYHAANA